MDWDNPPAIVAQGMGQAHQGPDIAQTWALSRAAWSQFAFLVASFALAWPATRRSRPATRRMAAEIAIFGAASLVLMNIPDIPLTSLAILGGAVGVGFAVVYRGRGISDGKNRDTPQALLATRNALKAHDIEFPFPQQVMRPSGPGAAASPVP